MQRSKVLGLSLLFVYLFLPVFSIAGSPELKVSELNWDWGRVPQNSFIYHKFWIKNVGTDILKGLNVRVA